jgi:ribonuclease Y
LSEKLEHISQQVASRQEELLEKEELIADRQSLLTQKNEQFQKKESQLDGLEKRVVDLKGSAQTVAKEYTQTLLQNTQLEAHVIKQTILDNLVVSLQQSFETFKVKFLMDSKEGLALQAADLIHFCIFRYTRKNAKRAGAEPLRISPVIWEKNQEVFALVAEVSGVEYVYDEKEKQLYVKHYNLVRKAIAFQALKHMVKKKKFSAQQAKLSLKQSSDRVHKHMMELGENVFKLLKINDPMFPPELKKLVGRMYYRTSYGQNILEHSIEVAYFSQMMAAELGLDIRVAKIAGLLHDLGKAIDQDTDEPHDLLTKKILEEYNIPYDIVHAAWNHHDAIPMETLEARIVQAADAFSAARPGARREATDDFAERVSMLEEKATAYSEVRKAYVIQAGREVRTLFDPHKVDDARMKVIVAELAQSIEEEGGYPGQIMVHGIRELRISRTAGQKRQKKTTKKK